jgi:hypothetical protein
MTKALPELEGAPNLFSVAFDLGSVGYSVHEHLVKGAATSYAAAGALDDDGRWEVKEAGNADFTTRCVIYCPSNPAHANGTVIVEWLNVTGGLDIPALWMPTHRHLVREGFTWVGISAQLVGVEGGGMMPGLGLRQSAPDRYGSLSHPGDVFSYDIFTQTASAARELLATQYSLHVEQMLATGASQSAFHLTTYINAVHPHAQLFDGFLIQGRAGAGAPLDGWTLNAADAADMEARRSRLRGRQHIRTDAQVPVMVVQSETDVFGTLQYLPARQPDNERFRLWEVAGAAHCDTYFLCAAAHDNGVLSVEELAALINRADSSGMPLEVPMNAGPQMHFVLQRAFDALDRWVRDGTAPPTAERIDTDGDGTMARDEVGVAAGGVRTPWVDAPYATFSGLGQPGDMTQLFGTTHPIAPEQLTARYPGGRSEFVDAFRAGTASAASAGFVLARDVEEIAGLGAASWGYCGRS